METLSMPVKAPSAGSYGPERRRSQEQAVPSAPQVFLDADGFIQILAHELRGPLAPLRNAGALLRRDGSDPHRVAQVADILDRTCRARLCTTLTTIPLLLRGVLSLRGMRPILMAGIRM